MPKATVLIVEDNILTAKNIEAGLSASDYTVCESCRYGEEVVEAVKKFDPDVVLMDINLAGNMNGTEASALLQQVASPVIIFLTDRQDEGAYLSAKSTLPYHYLQKPFVITDLIRCLDLALLQHHKTNGRKTVDDAILWISEESGFKKVEVKDIRYLEAQRTCCKIHLGNKTILATKSMQEIYSRINDDSFIRVHRSYVINLRYIDAIGNTFVKINDKKIAVSRANMPLLRERLGI